MKNHHEIWVFFVSLVVRKDSFLPKVYRWIAFLSTSFQGTWDDIGWHDNMNDKLCSSFQTDLTYKWPSNISVWETRQDINMYMYSAGDDQEKGIDGISSKTHLTVFTQILFDILNHLLPILPQRSNNHDDQIYFEYVSFWDLSPPFNGTTGRRNESSRVKSYRSPILLRWYLCYDTFDCGRRLGWLCPFDRRSQYRWWSSHTDQSCRCRRDPSYLSIWRKLCFWR